jgi:hypothetical protein
VTNARAQFHAAPPGWVAVYGGKGSVARRELTIAGFLHEMDPATPDDGGDVSAAVGRAVVCDPATGSLIGAAEWGIQEDLPLSDIRQEAPQPRKRDYDKWGERWPAYDVDRVIEAVESLAEKIGGIAEAVLHTAE